MARAPMRQQTVRVNQEKWDRFGELADAEGTDRSTLLRQFVDWYLRERGGVLPERPERTS